MNYRFALPNKLFVYILGGVPVLVSNFAEMKRVVEHYQIGIIAETHQRKELAELFKSTLFDQEKRLVWKQNLPRAASELCWEKEEKVLQDIYMTYK